jgi:hypothetical protein
VDLIKLAATLVDHSNASVADSYPGSGAFFDLLDPGKVFPGSQTHIFESLVTSMTLVTIVCVKSTIILRQFAQIFFCICSKIK